MNDSLAPAFRSAFATFLPIATRWMDNDAYGHVNNVTYYSYFDTVVNEHLIRAGGHDLRSAPAIGIVVETACRFHKPLSFPDVIDAGMRVAHMGHSSGIRNRALPQRRRRRRGNRPLRACVGGPRTEAPGARAAADPCCTRGAARAEVTAPGDRRAHDPPSSRRSCDVRADDDVHPR